MRLREVRVNATRDESVYAGLHAVYRKAWSEFCVQVTVWQSLLAEDPDADSIEIAKKRVERAQKVYQEKRNALADYLLSSSPRVDDLWPAGRYRMESMQAGHFSER